MKKRKFRKNPFAWQEKRVLRLIENRFQRKNKAPALALYTILCEIASNQGNEAELEANYCYLKTKAGLGSEKLKNLLKRFKKLKIISSKQTRDKKGRFGKAKIFLLSPVVKTDSKTSEIADSKTRSKKPRESPKVNGEPTKRPKGGKRQKTEVRDPEPDHRATDHRSQETIEDSIKKKSNYSSNYAERRKREIIFKYAAKKNVPVEDKEKKASFFKRNVRAAGNLVPYSLNRIEQTMDYLRENADFKWTLETVGKYIDEDLDKLTPNESWKYAEQEKK